MLNQYPLWKNLLIVAVLGLGLLYAVPNLYRPDPALQISGASSGVIIDQAQMERLSAALSANGIEHFGEKANESGKSGLIRLYDADVLLRAQRVVQRRLGDGFIVALNLASNTPEWLSNLGAQAMKLGLDLSGGVHFLLEVDTDSAIATRLEHYNSGIKKKLREEGVRGFVSLGDDGVITGKFTSAELRDSALSIIRKEFTELTGQRRDSATGDKSFYLSALINEA
jgi:preprotein translocase subunit SecD